MNKEIFQTDNLLMNRIIFNCLLVKTIKESTPPILTKIIDRVRRIEKDSNTVIMNIPVSYEEVSLMTSLFPNLPSYSFYTNNF